MTLRNRFVVLFVLFATVVGALSGFLSWFASKRALEEGLDTAMRQLADVYAEELLNPDYFLLLLQPGQDETPEWKEFQLILMRLENTHAQEADVFKWEPDDPDATVLVTTDPLASVGVGQRLSWVRYHLDVVGEASRNGYATSRLFEGNDGEHYKYGIRRLASEDVFLGLRYRADYLDPVRSLAGWLIGLSSAAALLGALIGWRLADGIVARLEILSRGALRIQRGFMDQPFDRTEEDELGRLARAMERMRVGIQRRDEQLRLMLSQVAHEIRNPLGGLELFSAAAQDTDDPKERRRILDRVREEIRGLNAVIDDFLGFARPERSRRRLHDVRDPVREAAALARAELEKKGGRLHVSLGDRPLLANADPRQVKRLVLNLLRNAAHAGDVVWVEGRMVRGETRITVRDDGPGVPEAIRDRIFEPFVGDKEQGAGLGLAIVKELVEANHGRVTLDAPNADGERPRPGGGAEFHVHLVGGEEFPGSGERSGSTSSGEETA